MGKGNHLWLKTTLSENATQYNFYHLAVEGDTESDVRQEHLERRLRKILGDKYDPFEKRYEFIKPITYEVRKHRHK